MSRKLMWVAGLGGGLMLAGVALAQVSTHLDLGWHLLPGRGVVKLP